jgi:hypothetical protein
MQWRSRHPHDRCKISDRSTQFLLKRLKRLSGKDFTDLFLHRQLRGHPKIESKHLNQ